MTLQSVLTTHPLHDIAAVLKDLRADLTARYAARGVYKTTYAELSALTDRQLADVGLDRSAVSKIAAEAAGCRS